MNADLTFNSIVFKKSFDEKDGSKRQSVARGVNTPDIMTIRSQDSTEGVLKDPSRRHTLSTDRVSVDADGVQYSTRIQTTLIISKKSSSTDISTVLATHKAAVADADLLANILNEEK